MIRNLIFVGLSVFVLSSVCCGAETAEEMLSACRPITQAKVSNGAIDLTNPDFNTGKCWGAFGMLQSVLSLTNPGGQRALHGCVPSDATRTQLIAIFVKHIEDHPKEYGTDFGVVALNSVLKVYSCDKKE